MKTVMDMAGQANLPSCHLTHPKALIRFAELVADRERQACIDLLLGLHQAQSNNGNHNYYHYAANTLKDLRGSK